MPFVEQQPRPFNRAQIEALDGNQYGVYGLHHTRWVYVGKGDIRQRLLDHLNGDNPCISIMKPTHFVAEVTTNADKREKELIREFTPTCNQRIG